MASRWRAIAIDAGAAVGARALIAIDAYVIE
jgi:hypothetical protein